MSVHRLRSGDPRGVGPYRFLGRLGAGGMGLVCLAQSPDGRLAAVKLVHEDIAADPDYRRRFTREVRAAATLNGRFTAALLAADPDAPQPWYAAEFIDGPTLGEVVRRSGPLPVPALRALAAGLADAVAALEKVGLVHRDLKPDNILLAADGPKLVDFGLARRETDSALTRAGSVLGSPGYMSPEQIAGLPVESASDVFALGAVLAYAAQGHGPFGAGPAEVLTYRTRYAEPRLTEVPDEFRALLLRCLAKNPSDRPTPRELVGFWSVRQDELDTLIQVGRSHHEAEPPSGERLYGSPGGPSVDDYPATVASPRPTSAPAGWTGGLESAPRGWAAGAPDAPGGWAAGVPHGPGSGSDGSAAGAGGGAPHAWDGPSDQAARGQHGWIPPHRIPWWHHPVAADRLPGGVLRDVLLGPAAAALLMLFHFVPASTALGTAFAATALALGFLLGVRRGVVALAFYNVTAIAGARIVPAGVADALHDPASGVALDLAVLLVASGVVARVGGLARPPLGFAVGVAAYIAGQAVIVATAAHQSGTGFAAAWRISTDGLLIYRDAGIAALCATAVGFLALLRSKQAVNVDSPYRATGVHR